MLREALIVASFLLVSCTSLRRETDKAEPVSEASAGAPDACGAAGAFRGVVTYDPHFHTSVRPPHAGTFVAPTVRVGDRVNARSQLAEIVWGPNRGKIVTPVDGVIVHAGATIGSFLRDADVPFVVADPRRLAARVEGLPRDAPALELFIDGLDPVVAQGGQRDGAFTNIALPAGLPAKVGAEVRVAFICAS